MNTLRFSAFSLALLLLAIVPARAQFAFGIESSCPPLDDFAKVSLPAATFASIISASTEGIPAADVCLKGQPGGTLNGFQADFDGDGNEEMWLHYSPDGMCNALAVLSPAGAGTYTLHDVMTLPNSAVMMRPITVLASGVQMYVQSSYTLPDGSPEIKGAVIAYTSKSMAILTSWTQKRFSLDGKPHVQNVRAAFADLNFDGTREMMVQVNTHESAGSLTEKNLVDQYVLTLDYMPSHLRYNIYDSAGYDKMQTADSKAASGLRMLHREATRTDGIVRVREALDINPFMTEVRVKLGEFFLMSGRYADAEKTLRIARDFDMSYPKTYKILGDTYLRLNDLQKSLDAYTTYLKLRPNAKDRKKVEHNIKQITIPKGRR